MNYLNKLERKFGRYAISNLTLYILIGYAIGYVAQFMSVGNVDITSYLVMNPELVLKGQVWRLFTWVITPPQAFDFLVLFMFMFFYWVGTSLERAWGSFRYNVYIFSGIIFMTLGAMVCYLVVRTINPEIATLLADGYVFNITTYYINMTSFLAFAFCFPEMQVYFMMIIPVKVKWLAVIDLIYFGYEGFAIFNYYTELKEQIKLTGINNMTTSEYIKMLDLSMWSQIVMLIIPLLNFFIFFFMTRNYKRISPKEIRRRTTYRREVHNATKGITKHKCAVCGRTEADSEDLVFRFCSKCNGNYEYCEDHLFTHEHK